MGISRLILRGCTKDRSGEPLIVNKAKHLRLRPERPAIGE